MPTWQQIADYAEWQVQNGRGKYQVEFNPHSIPCGWRCQLITVLLPDPSKYNKDRNVGFIDVVIER